jgi:hypothetical protein
MVGTQKLGKETSLKLEVTTDVALDDKILLLYV